MAADLAGFDVRVAVEMTKHAVETYSLNLCTELGTGPTIYNVDINELNPDEVFATHFGNRDICDLMLGGPPCQGFSSHRINNAGVDDPRNDLIHTYFRFVKAFQPTCFLMENVPGMLWPRHKQYLTEFMTTGRAAGYHVFDPVVLDARNFGVPQRRKRVFILGVLEGYLSRDLSWPPANTHGSPNLVAKDASLKPWKSCESAFLPAEEDDPNDIHMVHGPELTEAFAKTPPNGGSRKDSGRRLDCHKKHDGHNDVYGRIDPAQPGPTMTTACFNPSKGRFVHPTANHGITLRQAARIQTFPDDFVFIGGLTPGGKQIGNAVPVDLGRVLIEHIKPMIASARIHRESFVQERKKA